MPSPKALELAGKAVQRSFPFMKSLPQSTRAEQPWALMQGMDTLVNPSAAKPQPWDRLRQMVPEFRHPNVELNIPRGPSKRLDFSVTKPGASEWRGTVKPESRNPYELYIESLHSDASRRPTIGAEGALESYRMDISSPAQKELPLKGMKPQRGAERVARPPEERVPMSEFRQMRRLGYHQPGPSMTEKQGAMDRLMDLARRSGFKSLNFMAEPGERPRLYEKLVGYKAEPTGESGLDMMSRMLSNFPGRQAQHAGATPDRQMAPAVRRLLSSNEPMPPDVAEDVIGLSLEEGLDYGLIRSAQGGYQLTDQGRAAAQEWLGMMGNP